MLSAFWITDTSYQNIGGKNRQFESLEDVVAYAQRAKLADHDDVFSVHSVAAGLQGVPLEEVLAVFAAGHTPSRLDEVPELVATLPAEERGR